MKRGFQFIFLLLSLSSFVKIKLGIDRLFEEKYISHLDRKKVAIVTNQTGMDGNFRSTLDQLLKHQSTYQIVAIFSPEHGFTGVSYAGEKVGKKKLGKIPCYSLYGDHRRPTEEMLKGMDVMIYDIQEVGSRSYTYTSTLCYIMEEAAKRNIQVIVLDRPNPMGGIILDGPMLDPKERSFVSYLNVPYCHGMTIGELAQFFNHEYQIGCGLIVIPMKGWNREMQFQETGLSWVPTSPQIPEFDTPLYYPVTGILGELELVNIGVGYTLPFKIVGAPWINADQMTYALSNQKLPGVHFLPFHFKPFFGLYKHQECHGVRIVVTDANIFRPVTTGYWIMGVLKSLYPQEVSERLNKLPISKKTMFNHVNGTARIWNLFFNERYPGWKMASIDVEERKAFIEKRKKHLIY